MDHIEIFLKELNKYSDEEEKYIINVYDSIYGDQ